MSDKFNEITVICNVEHDITLGSCCFCERDALRTENADLCADNNALNEQVVALRRESAEPAAVAKVGVLSDGTKGITWFDNRELQQIGDKLYVRAQPALAVSSRLCTKDGKPCPAGKNGLSRCELNGLCQRTNIDALPTLRATVDDGKLSLRVESAPAAPADMVLVPRELVNCLPELNPLNYSNDEVIALNDWGIRVWQAAQEPKP